jgi:hypothetical protein
VVYENQVTINIRTFYKELILDKDLRTIKIRILTAFAAIILGILAILNAYLRSLGIVMIIWGLLKLGIKYILPLMIDSRVFLKNADPSFFKRYVIYKEPVVFGFDDDGLYMKGENIIARFRWDCIVQYVETPKWIKIYSGAMPGMYYLKNDLIEKGAYEFLTNILKFNRKIEA